MRLKNKARKLGSKLNFIIMARLLMELFKIIFSNSDVGFCGGINFKQPRSIKSILFPQGDCPCERRARIQKKQHILDSKRRISQR